MLGSKEEKEIKERILINNFINKKRIYIKDVGFLRLVDIKDNKVTYLDFNGYIQKMDYGYFKSYLYILDI